MRILLDSRDLIDVAEHQRNVTMADFSAFLRDGGHQNVLSFTNVRELTSPLAFGAEFLRLRTLLQSLAQLPHTYIKEATIVASELQSAVRAFETRTEYEDCSVYVTRWDRTFMLIPGQRQLAAENWVNFRLDEIVYYIHREAPMVFAPPREHLPMLRRLLENDRAALRNGQAAAREHFIRSLKRHAATHHVPLPNGREDELAEWVYENPDRCPGLRLNHETYRTLMANYMDVPETADFSDLAHVFAIPYVDAATLDRRMRHYCGIASQEMVRVGARSNYGDRVFANLRSIMQSHA
jgi:hypothetical protein